MTKRLLIIHHTPSPHTHEMFEAVMAGATDPRSRASTSCVDRR
jgi:hypothetical protein